jgi:hypothetical protein
MKSNRVLAALAIAGGALCLSTPATADPAAAQRLSAQARERVQQMQAPPMVPDGSYVFVIGQQRLAMTPAQLAELMTRQRGMLTSWRVEDFRIQLADCGPDLCMIRYAYRFSARAGATTSGGEVTNQEWWVRDGDTFAMTFGVSRQ